MLQVEHCEQVNKHVHEINKTQGPGKFESDQSVQTDKQANNKQTSQQTNKTAKKPKESLSCKQTTNNSDK